MFDSLVEDLSQRYGLGDRGRDLFGLLMAYVHNDRRGGFPGFIEGFREQGHGDLVSSWLGNPAAGGLTASDVGMVFGQGLLSDWGTRLGVSRATVAAAIAGVLPRLVAELTPGGRIPGGFGAPAPGPADRATQPGGSGDGAKLGATPVESLRAAAADSRPLPAPWDASDGSRETPSELRLRTDNHPGGAPGGGGHVPSMPSPSLRREPVLSPGGARAPVQAHPPLDAAGQRAADMAALFDRPTRAERTAPGALADVRPDNWRSAMQPPRRKRRLGGLFWCVLLLALLAGAAWYAWTQGLLAPYIEQYRLPIRSAPSTL